MTPPTISETGGKKKRFYGQFSVAFAPIELMFLQFYADRYGKDRVDILRGLLRKFVDCDPTFDRNAFIKWAEKTFLPSEEDKEMRSVFRAQLADFVEGASQTKSTSSRRSKSGT